MLVILKSNEWDINIKIHVNNNKKIKVVFFQQYFIKRFLYCY